MIYGRGVMDRVVSGRAGIVALALTFAFCGFGVPAGSCFALQQAPAEAPAAIQRLILNDGSYESVGRYSVEGDRVRYYSTERFAWEELPCSMIDWEATRAYAARSDREAEERREGALERAAEERREEEARTPLVAPGLRLPPEGVFLLDAYRGKQELNRLTQSGGDVNRNTGGNILRGILNPIAGSKQTVELKGRNARIRSHVFEPVLYFPVDPADPEAAYTSSTAGDHLRLARCTHKKGNRIVATIEIAIYGKVRQKAQYVEARVERVSDYWVRIAPAAPLKKGEYALIEVDAKGSLNQFVWDFGVDPDAPPNPDILPGSAAKKEPVLREKAPKADGR